MQRNIVTKEKPGATYQRRMPGVVSTPSKEFRHDQYRDFSNRSLLPSSIHVGKSPSRSALSKIIQVVCRSKFTRGQSGGAAWLSSP